MKKFIYLVELKSGFSQTISAPNIQKARHLADMINRVGNDKVMNVKRDYPAKKANP